MSCSLGLVGLPNAGKSTLFNSLIQKHQAQVAEYPFTTIDPNIGRLDVPDARLTTIAKITGVKKIIPSTLKVFDIAGLVRGAHRGHGLGNQFLSEINRVDLLVIVIRFFEHSNIPHPENNLHPGNDLQTILTELYLKDLATIQKAREKLTSQLKSGKNKPERQTLDVLEKLFCQLNGGQPAKVDPEQKKLIQDIPLLTLKSRLLVANCSQEQLTEADELIKNFCPDTHQNDWVYLDALAETQMFDLPTEDRSTLRQMLGLGADGLQELIIKSFVKLDLVTFFTYNQTEVRAWSIPRDTLARQAASQIHQDLARLFIKAEVIDFDSFQNHQRKYRTEGENYPVKDGEIVRFIINQKT